MQLSMSTSLALDQLPNPGLIPQPIVDMLERYASFPEVEFILVFGSRAIGDAEPRSDIDISISAPSISLDRWLEIRRIAEEEVNTLLWVTVVNFERSPPALQNRNLKEGVIVYERQKA